MIPARCYVSREEKSVPGLKDAKERFLHLFGRNTYTSMATHLNLS